MFVSQPRQARIFRAGPREHTRSITPENIVDSHRDFRLAALRAPRRRARESAWAPSSTLLQNAPMPAPAHSSPATSRLVARELGPADQASRRFSLSHLPVSQPTSSAAALPP